jgi:hypothetical protein
MAFRRTQLVVGRQQALVHRAAFHVRPQGGEPEEALASIEQGFGLAHGLPARGCLLAGSAPGGSPEKISKTPCDPRSILQLEYHWRINR